MVVVSEGQAPKMLPFVVIAVVGGIWYMVAVMVMVMIHIQSLLMRFLLLPG